MEQFSEEIKKALGDWKIVRLLGAGQYGKVYEIQRMDFGTLYRAADRYSSPVVMRKKFIRKETAYRIVKD